MAAALAALCAATGPRTDRLPRPSRPIRPLPVNVRSTTLLITLRFKIPAHGNDDDVPCADDDGDLCQASLRSRSAALRLGAAEQALAESHQRMPYQRKTVEFLALRRRHHGRGARRCGPSAGAGKHARREVVAELLEQLIGHLREHATTKTYKFTTHVDVGCAGELARGGADGPHLGGNIHGGGGGTAEIAALTSHLEPFRNGVQRLDLELTIECRAGRAEAQLDLAFVMSGVDLLGDLRARHALGDGLDVLQYLPGRVGGRGDGKGFFDPGLHGHPRWECG